MCQCDDIKHISGLKSRPDKLINSRLTFGWRHTDIVLQGHRCSYTEGVGRVVGVSGFRKLLQRSPIGSCSLVQTHLKQYYLIRVFNPVKIKIKTLIESSLNLAPEHLHLFSAKCAFFSPPSRPLSTTCTQLVFMYSSSHKTSTPSLHTFAPLMRLIGAAFGLTLFGSFFIFFVPSLTLSPLMANTDGAQVWRSGGREGGRARIRRQEESTVCMHV